MKEVWFKKGGKIFKGYLVAESNSSPYMSLIKVPKLHNKLVQIPWAKVMSKKELKNQ